MFGTVTGFSAVIPGFPRYSVIGDSKNGVFNLRVVNATLEDDAEFQCQVGPANFHKAIRADARLSVICKLSTTLLVHFNAQVMCYQYIYLCGNLLKIINLRIQNLYTTGIALRLILNIKVKVIKVVGDSRITLSHQTNPIKPTLYQN